MKTLYFDCSSGAAGDMIVAALINCGVPLSTVTECIETLGVEGLTVRTTSATKGAVQATAFIAEAAGDPVPRAYRDIVTLLTDSRLPEAIRSRSLDAFALLAGAEAKIHGTSMEDIHFHEVGGVDAIADIVAACAALEHIGPDRVVVSPIATGRGTAVSMHGTIPVPAPAVLEILAGAELYERGSSELITPTGAALLASWADSFGPMPQMKLEGVGYGAGTADLEWPNVLRVIAGEQPDVERSDLSTELIETNIDDMSPELLPYVIERTLEAGALDAWATPVHMKKGRIGAVLSVLVERGASEAVLDVLFRETTTFGVRISAVDRETLDRKILDVVVEGHTIRVKVGYRDGIAITSSPEYEDAARVARTTGMALRDVYRAALERIDANFL
jgi:uncharacterized protein (TIGR00299 family) protein